MSLLADSCYLSHDRFFVICILVLMPSEEAAARAYDLAALKSWGPETVLNFHVSSLLQGNNLLSYCFICALWASLTSFDGLLNICVPRLSRAIRYSSKCL
jgi:hypothetical protein